MTTQQDLIDGFKARFGTKISVINFMKSVIAEEVKLNEKEAFQEKCKTLHEFEVGDWVQTTDQHTHLTSFRKGVVVRVSNSILITAPDPKDLYATFSVSQYCCKPLEE